MGQIHLWQEEAIAANGLTTISTTVESPQQSRFSLWYRLPSEYNNYLTKSCDAFVIATILTAMRQSTDLIVHGSVSPSLLRNLEEFQAAWSCWRPTQYHPVAIHAEVEQEQSKTETQERAISAFSGGVDSCYTAMRHRRQLCGRSQRNLEAGMMVHGFDIPIKQAEAFERAAQRSKVMLSSLDMELIPMATNFRQVIKTPWEDGFGTAIASCLMLVQQHFTVGLIPASYPYHALGFPYGSNPITDRLMSNQGFEIVHDGAIASRTEKMRQISTWTEALHNLRVCWEGADKDRNCGRCEKCVRNILTFRVIGINSPPCFDQDVTNREIAALRVKHAQLDALKDLLQSAEAAHITDSWVHALGKAIHRNQRIETLKSYLPHSLKKKLQEISLSLKP